ncbi:hypothetical protein [Pseudomonas sp. dw_358]|uniref:hypothetical protein n=1 Tax=Pseudomonas sp. dw_358 TaxID=2720083 RepID=UPI001BD4148E|nr:hypothetical protein [Pseudomonas sp. dw_358]
MKSSDGFNPRRLRPRGQRNWGARLGAVLAAVLAMLGILLTLAGLATLVGHPPQATGMDLSTTGAIVLAVGGLMVLYLGVLFWRLCRRRMRRGGALDMSPHLMRKHD